MNDLQAEKNYLTEQFEALGHTVTSVEFGDDETITVVTQLGTYQMIIGSDDDCFVFSTIAGTNDIVTFPFLGDRAMGL